MTERSGGQRGLRSGNGESGQHASVSRAPMPMVAGDPLATAHSALGNQDLQRLASEGQLPMLLAASGAGLGNQTRQALLRKAAPPLLTRKASAPEPLPPALLPRPLMPAGRLIQRFNAAADDARKPTRDLAHPAVVNLGLTDFGPYTFNPSSGTWTYKVKAPGAPGAEVDRFLKRLIKHKNAAVVYEAEQPALVAKAGGFNWQNPVTKANLVFHPNGVKAAVTAARVAKATSLYYKTTVAYPAGKKPEMRTPGKVLDAIKSHGAGNAPRPFVSIAQEDVLGAPASHNQSRHVVGGADMPNNEAVAVRAAFGILGGFAGGGKGAYSPVASAYKTVADADMDVGNAINTELTNNWNVHRVKLVTDGGVRLKVPRAGGQIVAFKSTKGGKWGAAEKPEYLVPGAGGLKPLFYPDARYDAWATGPGLAAGFDAAKYAANKVTPLTQDTTATLVNVNVRIVSSTNPNAKGWVINSAYPTN